MSISQKYFFACQGHHSLEEICQEVRKTYPGIGQTTVYRTIKLMCEVGLAEELHVGENFARYEVCIGKQHHDHLVCTACGKTIEFHLPEIEKYQKEIAEKTASPSWTTGISCSVSAKNAARNTVKKHKICSTLFK